jgi:hypothetical protein
MRTTYRALAYLVALGVMVQAASVAFGFFGLGKYVEDGGTLDKATLEGDLSFTGALGLSVHSIDGSMVIPAIAVLLLVVSFFAKLTGGVRWAGFVFLAVVVQVLLGVFAHVMPALGMLHGLNALVLFGVALRAGMLPRHQAGRGAHGAGAGVSGSRRRCGHGTKVQGVQRSFSLGARATTATSVTRGAILP